MVDQNSLKRLIDVMFRYVKGGNPGCWALNYYAEALVTIYEGKEWHAKKVKTTCRLCKVEYTAGEYHGCTRIRDLEEHCLSLYKTEYVSKTTTASKPHEVRAKDIHCGIPALIPEIFGSDALALFTEHNHELWYKDLSNVEFSEEDKKWAREFFVKEQYCNLYFSKTLNPDTEYRIQPYSSAGNLFTVMVIQKLVSSNPLFGKSDKVTIPKMSSSTEADPYVLTAAPLKTTLRSLANEAEAIQLVLSTDTSRVELTPELWARIEKEGENMFMISPGELSLEYWVDYFKVMDENRTKKEGEVDSYSDRDLDDPWVGDGTYLHFPLSVLLQKNFGDQNIEIEGKDNTVKLSRIDRNYPPGVFTWGTVSEIRKSLRKYGRADLGLFTLPFDSRYLFRLCAKDDPSYHLTLLSSSSKQEIVNVENKDLPRQENLSWLNEQTGACTPTPPKKESPKSPPKKKNYWEA